MDKIFFTKEHIYKRDLKEEDLIPEEFDRPADELIYLRHNEHAALHNKYRK